ncbi:MAG: choice-of-anchor C family protein, partial [Planctomycetota bacterium]
MNYRKQSSIRIRWLTRRVRQLCRLLRTEFANKTGQQPSGIFAQELEPRVLYDASPLGAVSESDIQEPLDLADTTFYEDLDSAAPDEWTISPDDSALWIEATPPVGLDPEHDSLLPSGTVELLAIDLRVLATSSVVENLAALDQGSEKLEVIVIDAESNGINLVSERLKSLRNVSAVHLIALQDPRGTHLGQSELGPDSIPGLQQTFSLWRQSLESDASVLLYGWWEPTGSSTLQLTEHAQLLCDPALEDSSLWASISQGAYPCDLSLDSATRSAEMDREADLNRLLGVTAELTAGWLDSQAISSPCEPWPHATALPEPDLEAWFGELGASGKGFLAGITLPAEFIQIEDPAVDLGILDNSLDKAHTLSDYSAALPEPAVGDLALPPETIATETLRGPHTHELFVVDGSLGQLENLLQSWRESATPGIVRDFLVIQPGENGLETIARHLAQAEIRYDALHLFTHGSSGEIQLGNLWLGQSTLEQAAHSLELWKVGLSDEADLLVYGCRVAADEVAQDWLVNLAGLLQVDLAASTDLTGSAARGGDWDLEFALGQIETKPLASAGGFGNLDILLATGTANADLIVGTTGTDTHDGLGGDDAILAGPNAVSDGQFLQGTVSGAFQVYNSGSTFGGWTVTAGSVDLVGTGWQASPTGGRSVDLDGSAPGTISQTITTVAGNTYSVRFLMSANGTSATKALEVSAGGTSFDAVVTTTASHSASNMEWHVKTFNFVATSSSTTLTFKSLSTAGPQGAVVADVTVADLTSNQGNDTIMGGTGNDTIYGSGGHDTIAGGAGDDLIRAGGGNDTVEGGAGNDTVQFSGNRNDYRVTLSGSTYTVQDLRSGTPEGTDNILNVESFAFADVTLTAAEVATHQPIFEDFEGSNLTGWTGGAVITSSADHSAFLASATASGTPGSYLSATNGVQDVHKTFTLSGNQAAVTLSFTLHRLDTWDGEQFRVWINDTLVSSSTYSQGSVQARSDSTPDTAGNVNLGVGGGDDAAYTVVINQVFTGTTFKVGFGATLDESWSNESWGVDNLTIIERGSGVSNSYAEGTTGANTYTGTSNYDSYAGDLGNDKISVVGGTDFVSGGDGADTIDLVSESDVGLGSWGDDTIAGGTGSDILDGGAGNDTLYGDGTNLVVNGSFESALATGWTTTGNVSANTAQGRVLGSSAVAFGFANTANNGVLSQIISTTTGARYTLGFDYGAFANPSNQSLRVLVVSGGFTVLDT